MSRRAAGGTGWREVRGATGLRAGCGADAIRSGDPVAHHNPIGALVTEVFAAPPRRRLQRTLADPYALASLVGIVAMLVMTVSVLYALKHREPVRINFGFAFAIFTFLGGVVARAYRRTGPILLDGSTLVVPGVMEAERYPLISISEPRRGIVRRQTCLAFDYAWHHPEAEGSRRRRVAVGHLPPEVQDALFERVAAAWRARRADRLRTQRTSPDAAADRRAREHASIAGMSPGNSRTG